MDEKEYLSQLHSCLQEILDFFHDICEKNNYKYILAYGTALGAKRHNGFIPWDDDLDVAMPREDYNRFVEYMHTHENDTFSIQDVTNENNYFLSFSKIRKNNTLFKESITDGLYNNNGLFIDIFPLDYVDDPNNEKYIRCKKKTKYICHALRYRFCSKYYRKESMVKYLVNSLVSLPYRFFSKESLVKKLDELATCLGNNKSKYFCIDELRNIHKKDDIFPAEKILFEGKEYYVANNIDSYLRECYGCDYMTLPPVEKRMTHMPLEVKF